MSDKDKKKDKDGFINAVIVGSSSETVQRFGSAVKEHIVAYEGIDHETGSQLSKGLKSVSQQKVNPDFKKTNLRQQSGFSAEIKSTARYNAEAIIKDDPIRKVRTDDIDRTNDPLYDHVKVDASRNIISGSESQMKFVGKSPKEALAKLVSPKFSKYLEHDAKIEVPSDYYQNILDEADIEIAKLEGQLKRQSENGNVEEVTQIEKRIADYKKIKTNLRDSGVSNKEALFARTHPKLSTATDIAKISHRAGMKTAATSVIIGGSVSVVRNIVNVIKDEESKEQAVINIAKDTATVAAVGYGTGFAGSAVKGFMQNSKSAMTRSLSKTNLPATLVTLTVGSTETMYKYFNGEIDGVECLEELGEQGTGMVASALGATVGHVAIPIPIVGAMIGSMVGYALSSASYGMLTAALKDEKLAKEQRKIIEAECEAHILLIREYRTELQLMVSEYLNEHMTVFNDSFDQIKTALDIGNIDGFISATNQISQALGHEVLYESQSEFDALILDPSSKIRI